MGNIVKAQVGKGRDITTAPLFQYDYGQILMIEGIELPTAYQVHFSNEPYGSSTTSIGTEDGVTIPDAYLQGGGDVFAWLYLHEGEDDGETVLTIRIPVKPRAAITNAEPTPVQQEEIDELITALNAAVDTAEDAAAAAEDSAEDAGDFAEDAEAWAVGKRGGVNVGNSDPAYHNNSKYFKEQASTSATLAQGYSIVATNKAQAAGNAKTAAETAQGKAEDAQTAAETAQGKAEDAQTAAEAAQAAAEDAQEAIEDMSVTASTLSAGSSATVTKCVDPGTGAVTLAFGIPQGDKGDTGSTGQTGATGTTFTPSVSNEGVISWSNDGGKQNPASVNIKGPQGPAGDPTTIIDDTAGTGDTGKVWSASKSAGEVSSLQSALQAKIDEPSTEGTSGQVLTTDGNGGRSWTTPSGGGSVTDVQVNGTSVVTRGVANVPVASDSELGTVKVDSAQGVVLNNSNTLILATTVDATFKTGTSNTRAVVPSKQHVATFYGLAKAAGSDEKNSTKSLGIYSENAKSAISEMLNATETISGSTPSITAKAGVRYVCGEVSTLTIVVPSSGIIDVLFESGSTATVLTVTPPTGVTMKWANGFDPASLDANTTYEINIMDGCLGVAGSWT